MFTFKVGDHYCNRKGEYEVLDIQGDTMTVHYNTGEQQQLSIPAQITIYENIQREKVIAPKRPTPILPQTQQFYWSLGFLLARINSMLVFIPQHALSSFKDNFYDATGQELSEDTKGVIIHPPETDKRWYECRVTFQAKPNELYLLNFGYKFHEPVEASPDHNLWNLNDNTLFFRLLEFNFVIGGKQNKAKIENAIPNQYQVSFNGGYSRGNV